MKSIFIINCGNDLMNARLYSTRELAREALKKIADNRRHKPGVNVIRDEPDRFMFLIGWEEHPVSFRSEERELDVDMGD